MATTTNYGWTTPDDTALVKDGAAAIRTLGSSVDTTTKALNPSTTLGDIEYRSSTANTNTRLGIGSTGNVLTVAGGVPTWAAPAGGKLLQVVQATSTTSTTTTSNSVYSDTTLTASITPSSATSKVLIIFTQSMFIDSASGSNENGMNIKLLRNSTDIVTLSPEVFRIYVVASSQLSAIQSYTYLDSPSTTSATTYKTQFRATQGGKTVGANYSGCPSSIVLMEIGA